MNNLAIFCADIGSIKTRKFGWGALLPDGKRIEGPNIEDFARYIADEIIKGTKVALGFECPLFVPMRSNPQNVNGARNGEGNRSWSAGAGTGALATGLVEVLWAMNEIKRLLEKPPRAEFSWADFKESESVFLWEAFVTSTAKGAGHCADALIAIDHFETSIHDPWAANAIQEENVLSLVGAAALRAGWAEDLEILSKPCLVIKAVC